MPSFTAEISLPQCNCLALRQAARHVSQFYDQYLAPSGLRTTQFSILAKLKRLGPMTINALARELVMDRTTLGRTMLPLERDGLIAIREGTVDRRSKELAVTKSGTERLQRAVELWVEAQKEFEERFGAGRAADLRGLLGDVVSCELEKPAATSTRRRRRTRARL
ncbi:MAG TPA: MarR family transcriptional regulator [Casimicrobiaceae bacterium]|nr:MarR family transcriptional regulator [Casimicrobiaceae bacterium]